MKDDFRQLIDKTRVVFEDCKKGVSVKRVSAGEYDVIKNGKEVAQISKRDNGDWQITGKNEEGFWSDVGNTFAEVKDMALRGIYEGDKGVNK